MSRTYLANVVVKNADFSVMSHGHVPLATEDCQSDSFLLRSTAKRPM